MSEHIEERCCFLDFFRRFAMIGTVVFAKGSFSETLSDNVVAIG